VKSAFMEFSTAYPPCNYLILSNLPTMAGGLWLSTMNPAMQHSHIVFIKNELKGDNTQGNTFAFIGLETGRLHVKPIACEK